MVAVGGIFMVVITLEPSKTPKSVWANAWFDTGFGFLVAGLIVVALGLYLNFRKQGTGSSGNGATARFGSWQAGHEIA